MLVVAALATALLATTVSYQAASARAPGMGALGQAVLAGLLV